MCEHLWNFRVEVKEIPEGSFQESRIEKGLFNSQGGLSIMDKPKDWQDKFLS